MKKKLLAVLLALVMALGLVGTAGEATHTVKAGDNLSKIAAEYLGDSTRWKEIYEANKDIISNPNAIYVGQTLTIPSTDEPATPDEPVCPTLFLPLFLRDEIPQEHKDCIDMAREYLRRARVLVVCGSTVDESVKNDIAVAKRLRITATTLDGILTVKGQGRRNE